MLTMFYYGKRTNIGNWSHLKKVVQAKLKHQCPDIAPACGSRQVTPNEHCVERIWSKCLGTAEQERSCVYNVVVKPEDTSCLVLDCLDERSYLETVKSDDSSSVNISNQS